MALPPAILVAPSSPAGPRPGLLDAVVGPMEMPDHVQTSGAQWWSEMCGGSHLYPPACLTPPYPAFTADPGDGLVSAYPFVVYASEICGVMGSSDEEAVARATQRLAMGAQTSVEHALWGGGDGVTGVFETLQAAGSVQTIGPATGGPVQAIGLLEQQAAVRNYNGPLFIHARPRVAAYLAYRGLIRELAKPTDFPQTHYGSRYVFGAGYSGELPDGTDPTGTVDTMYVTGRIFLWRESKPWVMSPPDSLNRTTNQRTIIVGQAYAMGVECLTAATAVTLAAVPV